MYDLVKCLDKHSLHYISPACVPLSKAHRTRYI